MSTSVSRAADGSKGTLDTFVLGEDDRGLGSTVELDIRHVTQLRLRDERRGVTYVADF